MIIETKKGEQIIIDRDNGVYYITRGDEVGVILAKSFSENDIKVGRSYFLIYCPLELVIKGRLKDIKARRPFYFNVKKIIDV